MTIKSLFACAVAALSLAACDHVRTHSITKEPGTVTAMEGTAKTHLTYIAERDTGDHILCAAASPDALQADAFSVSASGGSGAAGGGGALGQSSTAAYVGMRTQTIQLLRDGYYRLCEAYLNNVISREQYNLHLTNMPRVVAMAMAIDAVAGGAVAPAAVIHAAAPSVQQTPGTGNPSQPNPSVSGQPAGPAFSATARAPAINEEAANVLLGAIKSVNDGTMVGYCALLLSDPEAPEPPTGTYRSRMFAHCDTLLRRYVSETTVAKPQTGS